MNLFSATCLVALGAGVASFAHQQDGVPAEEAPAAAKPAMPDMATMMKMISPGEHHAALGRMVGSWTTSMRMTMPGMGNMKPTAGTAEIDWLMKGRWLRLESRGVMMGMPVRSFSLMGYDNMKKSYVSTSVSSMDTAMNRNEGDMNRDGSAIVLYGQMDEYLTGEHDKMVKTAFRFVSDDEFVMEVHDLHIGEGNSMVVEVTYTRAPAAEGDK